MDSTELYAYLNCESLNIDSPFIMTNLNYYDEPQLLWQTQIIMPLMIMTLTIMTLTDLGYVKSECALTFVFHKNIFAELLSIIYTM